MICKTCSADIPPSFVHAIANNSCPGCGGKIVSDETKALMDQLKEAIPKMIGDTEGLVGWLMSTFDMFPKGTIEATSFHREHREHRDNSPTPGNIKWANTPTNQFMKRSGADKVMNNPKLAEIANAINSANADSSFIDVEEEVVLTPEEQEEQEAAEAQRLQELAAAARKQGKRLTAKDLLANNVILEGSGEPLSQQEVRAMQSALGGEQEETEDLPPALHADRLKRLARQREMMMGSVGKISRRE